MKFGPVAVGDVVGAILAHSVRTVDGTIRKGTVLDAGHVAAMEAAGLAEVVVAQLDKDDVHEDAAASTIASGIAGGHVRVEPPFTGRANLYAEVAGVVRIDRETVDRLNRVDPAVTVATVPDYATVESGQMVATVKIIPFAVRKAIVDALGPSPAVRTAPFRSRQVGLVATVLPSLKASVMDKTRRLLDARLARSGSSVMAEARVAHDAGAVADALKAHANSGAGLLIAFGASAVVDAADVIPAAIEKAGGYVLRLGMPVDPGNLLVLGEIGGVPVIGAPGCARSPKENGFDWMLNRLLADVPVGSGDVAALGVGGLLTEISSRPQPRDVHRPRIAAVLLAAGSSRRMGEANKLLAVVDGKPLVRLAAEAAVGSRADSLTVVTGHERARVESALAGLDVAFVHNPDHAAGLSTSLRAGLTSLPEDVDGAIILLADMPGITSSAIDRLIGAFRPAGIVVPVSDGRRGNPVLWSRRFFPDLLRVKGDTGGRGLINANPGTVTEVELGGAVTVDIDTPEALAAVGGEPV